MTPRHRGVNLCGRWLARCTAALIALAPAPASAYTFNLIGDGSGQHLNWMWESCTFSCLTSGTCGSFNSVNGNIPYSSNGTGGNLAGGLLEWTSTSGSLSILAMPTVSAIVTLNNACSGRWAAVDAREIPMLFSITPEAGDPFPLNVTLHVQPRLVGTIEQYTTPGNVANLWVQMMATVSVDGQIASADSFYSFLQLTNDADSLWQLKFPKGGANSVLVPNVTPGSEILVRIWAYVRGYVQTFQPGWASIYSSSVHGAGAAIEIAIRDQNAVDVAAEPDPTTLSLTARPNPSPGAARIEYMLPRASQVRLSLFDIAGARVATLVDRFEAAGRREVPWNGRDARGALVPAGVYVVELAAGADRNVSKLVVLER